MKASMNYKTLITKNYPKIMFHVRNKAFRFYLNESDLLSLVNEKIAVRLNNSNFQFDDDRLFWGYIHKVISSAAVDLKRDEKFWSELENYNNAVEYDLEAILTARVISDHLFSDIKNDLHRDICTEILVHGESYENTSDKLSVPMCVVKNAVFLFRRKSIKKYNQVYQTAIA